MEKVVQVIYTTLIVIGLTITILGIFYKNAPNVEKQDITETTIVEINKVEQ